MSGPFTFTAQVAGPFNVTSRLIEQVSLVRNYRGSYQDIVRERGIAGLISELETKVAASSGAEE